MQFSRDLGLVFSSKLLSKLGADDSNPERLDGADGPQAAESHDLESIHNLLNEVRPGTAEHLALTQDQKDLKRLAKRIVKAVKDLIEEAMRKEADLHGLGREEAMRKLDSFALFSATGATKDMDAEDESKRRSGSDASVAAGAAVSPRPTYRQDANGDTKMADAGADGEDEAVDYMRAKARDDVCGGADAQVTPASLADSHPPGGNVVSVEKPAEPLSPPISNSSAHAMQQASMGEAGGGGSGGGGGGGGDGRHAQHDVFAHGGVAWYLQPFDPTGTTVHEERYTGRQVLRDMSEELSDMDEDTLTELVGEGGDLGAQGGEAGAKEAKKSAGAKKGAAKRKKPRKSPWSR